MKSEPGNSRADPRLCDRLLRRAAGEFLREAAARRNGSTSMKSTVPAMVVRRFSVEKRRMRWIAGMPGGQRAPVIGLALAERRDEAHPGDGDEGATEAITNRRTCSTLLTGTRRCIRPRQGGSRPSPRWWPTLVTTASGASPRAIAAAASATPTGACASIRWPNASWTARTRAPGARRSSAARSSSVRPLHAPSRRKSPWHRGRERPPPRVFRASSPWRRAGDGRDLRRHHRSAQRSRPRAFERARAIPARGSRRPSRE